MLSTPLELAKCSRLSRAFPGAPERIGSNGGAFRMLRDLTIRIVKFSSYWGLCTGLQETVRQVGSYHQPKQTPRVAETSAHLCGRLDATFSHQWFFGPQPQGSSSIILLFGTGHKICYIKLITISKFLLYLYIQWYWENGDGLCNRKYYIQADPVVDTHHLIIQNTHLSFPALHLMALAEPHSFAQFL